MTWISNGGLKGMEGIVRNAVVGDGEAIANLVRISLGSDCDGKIVDEKIREMSDDSRCTFVVESNGKIVVFIDAESYSPVYYFERHMNITGLAVDPKFRYGKCGSNLINELKVFCKEKGFAGIRVDSNLVRKGAHTFYRTVGFLDIKEQFRFFMKL